MSNIKRTQIPEDVYADFVDTVKRTEVFTPEEIEWLESILSRSDGPDGYRQLTQSFIFARADQGENIYAACKAFNRAKAELSPFELHEAREMLRGVLWSKRASMYRQKKLIIAAPQRRKHAKYDCPNLHNWEGAGQHINTVILPVYGLNYIDARTQCVKTALADPDASHILFIDDDVLLPKDFARVLIDTGLPSVAGIYTKKSTAFQSNATTSGADAQYIFNQKIIDPKEGDMTPTPATCVGGGMWLLALDIFRKLPEPWFAIVGGSQPGQIKIGEDSMLCQKLAGYGVMTHVIPGLVGIHMDFTNGNYYAPAWLIDPLKLRIRPEVVPHFHPLPEDLDTRELVAADVQDFFGKNVKLREQGLLKEEEKGNAA